MRTGIFGGTFNPIHLAHLAIAEEARRACRLDRVIFLPAADPPHKPIADDVPFIQRLAMVEAALAGHAGFCASDLEAQRSGKSYSVETLKILRHQHPDDSFYFIIGLDSFRDLATWKSYRQLFQLCHLVVVSRPGISTDLRQLLPIAIRQEFCYSAESKNLRHCSGNTVIFLEEPRLEISSTEIRRRVAARQTIQDLVPLSVADYIERHGLYEG
ncbi:MAG TPA: nicotinate-nucleotide adenylyltransferase [Geothermobacteraceae bacterium]|nr:nicotinate-nucleotide adenylyltransferase [Geothermobacteraceae bacterium]